MRYVMVPVPTEHVLDVMRWVLFRSPEDGTTEAMRDQARLRHVIEGADPLTLSILTLVAGSTISGATLRLADAADELDHDADVVRASLRELNGTALGGGRVLIRLASETAVWVNGNVGRDVCLEMRPEHARMIRTLTRAADAPPE